MTRAIRIGIAGDYRAHNPTHTATDDALAHAAAHLSVAIEARWLPTDTLAGVDAGSLLAECDGVLISPGSPYRSMEGALRAIQYAREADVPLIGTCGGLQHMVIEYARNVLGVADAAHAESDPDASHLFITPLSCSLFGQTMNVTLRPGTRAQAYYGADEALENYYCSFGLNPDCRGDLEAAGLRISGSDADGEPRVFELPDHRFFIGTLFVPQTRSTPAQPHPLITAFVAAASQAAARAGDGQPLTAAPSL
jgi:CTP synthase (UTP-ammonia lyase)